MRRTGHIRQRSPGSWELRYSTGTDPATGKRQIATATLRGDRKAAVRELRRLLRALDDGSHVDPLTTEESERLLQSIKDTRTYWPVMLALATGMRRGEVLALGWKNVDLNRGVLRVVQSLEQTKAELRFKDTKSSQNRAITLPAFAVEELRRLKREQAEELLALGIRQPGKRWRAVAPMASRCSRAVSLTNSPYCETG